MISIDTNILFKAAVPVAENHAQAREFIDSLQNKNVMICELVLSELYILLRNPIVTKQNLPVAKVMEIINALRNHPTWALVENAPVMAEVWKLAATENFARRRLYDIRLGLTLRHHGVKEFATINTKDFEGLGFDKVFNPLGT